MAKFNRNKVINKIKKKMASREKEAKERKRLNEWFMFLKDDCDWDYGDILKVFQYKLERVAKCISTNNIIIKKEANKVAKEIRSVTKILDRVMADNYHDKYEKELRKKYGKTKHDMTEKLPNGDTVWKIYREKETKENEAEISAACREAYLKADEDKKADLKKAFDIMVEKLWGWWD